MNSAIPRSLLLTGAQLVLKDEVVERGSVLLAGGRIERIFRGYANGVAGDVQRKDLSGAMLFPGFIDVHIHGAIGVDTMEADTDGLSRVSKFLASQGVTAWLPTLVPAPAVQYERSINSIAAVMSAQAEQSFGARVLGVHYEGPFVNRDQCGALHLDHFRTFTKSADLDTLPTLSERQAVHLMTLAPEIEGGIELITELCRRGWTVSLGHTRANTETLDRARTAGAGHMTHFMNAMAPLHHRAPGPIGWGLMRDDVTCDVIADGIHLDRMTLQLLRKLKTPARLALISDAIAAAGMGDGEYQIWGETIAVTAGRTQNSHGSIAGSVITMLDAVRMMLLLGASEPEVAQMAAANPARLLGIDDDCGSLEEGKRADLVALDQHGGVSLTVVRGLMDHTHK